MCKTRTPRSTSMAQILQFPGDKRGNGNKFHFSEGIFRSREKQSAPAGKPADGRRGEALASCSDAFSSREPVPIPDQVRDRLSLENALGCLSVICAQTPFVARKTGLRPATQMRGTSFRIMLSMGGPPVFLRSPAWPLTPV